MPVPKYIHIYRYYDTVLFFFFFSFFFFSFSLPLSNARPFCNRLIILYPIHPSLLRNLLTIRYEHCTRTGSTLK
ncbi:hypothetical protein B9Z19DRAFT_1092704 [Tuber borchii]|uniref:Uncharacterized protein n=1 Tax=Tuber borchii TaxID=42251 RepID=A0A2T6ZG94_TUBBO|nr:hypothetical protein B9Z19DRAFT_1092704 [Tuber borchii]